MSLDSLNEEAKKLLPLTIISLGIVLSNLTPVLTLEASLIDTRTLSILFLLTIGNTNILLHLACLIISRFNSHIKNSLQTKKSEQSVLTNDKTCTLFQVGVPILFLGFLYKYKLSTPIVVQNSRIVTLVGFKSAGVASI